MKTPKPINIIDKFSLFEDKWNPKIVGEVNGQYVKVCKFKDDFVWHNHQHEDELFIVFRGTLLIDFRNGSTTKVKEGEILVVPKGLDHRPYTNGEIVYILLIEPSTTLNTGDANNRFTVKNLEWI